MQDARARNDRRTRIWRMILSPSVWACHLLASYITAAIFCAKHADSDGSAGEVQVAIIVYTAIALPIIVVVGWRGFRDHRRGDSTIPHDGRTHADQNRLLGWATFLLSVLSGVAVVFTALVAVFVGSCH